MEVGSLNSVKTPLVGRIKVLTPLPVNKIFLMALQLEKFKPDL